MVRQMAKKSRATKKQPGVTSLVSGIKNLMLQNGFEFDRAC